jgi:hypothetical protein
MPLTIILFKNVLRDSELYASDSTRLAVAAASDAAATNRRRSCPRVSHHSTARSSEQPASPSARIQGGGGATAIRLSRKLRAAGQFFRSCTRTPFGPKRKRGTSEAEQGQGVPSRSRCSTASRLQASTERSRGRTRRVVAERGEVGSEEQPKVPRRNDGAMGLAPRAHS